MMYSTVSGKPRSALIVLLVSALLLGACGSKPSEQKKRDQAAKDKLVITNVRLAGIYLQRGQLNFAKEKADKAIEADPSSSMANNMMGILSWRLKEYDNADRYFRRAVRYGPDNALAANNYGAFLCDMGKIDDSLEYFDRAAENPYYEKRSGAMTNAGRCLMKKPDSQKAETYFRRALKYNANEAEALYYLAQISYDTNRTLTARGFLERYFATGSQSAESLYLAVRVENAMGNKRLAIRYARRLKDQYPTSPEASRVKIR
jgi:type IV pilus assembly protein PilF